MADKEICHYFSHDANARHNEKIIALRMKYDWKGYGLYWAIIEKLREGKCYKLSMDYNIIAYDLRCDSAEIKSIIEDFGLFAFTENGECFYSESLCERMAIKEVKSEKARIAANKKWDTSPDSVNETSRSQRMSLARKKGRHTAREWNDMKDFFGNTCVKCNGDSHMKGVVKNHIIPIYQGGSDGISNIQPLCSKCNASKGSEDIDHRIPFCSTHNLEMDAEWLPNDCGTTAELLQEKKRKEKKNKEKREREFSPPSITEIERYVAENSLSVDPHSFFKFYKEGKWIDSKGNPVTNWKQKVLSWNRHSKGQGDNNGNDKPVSLAERLAMDLKEAQEEQEEQKNEKRTV